MLEFQNQNVLLAIEIVITTKSVYPDEMLCFVPFYLGRRCLQNQYAKG